MDVSSEYANRYRPRNRWSDEQNTRYVYDLRDRDGDRYPRDRFNYMHLFILLIVIILVIMLVSAATQSGPTVVSRTQYVV